MHQVDFCYWLQGYVEMGGGSPNETQWKMIKDHLAEVFRKVTPTGWTDKGVGQEKLPVEASPAPATNPMPSWDDILKPTDRKGSGFECPSTAPSIQPYIFPQREFYPHYQPNPNDTWIKTGELICQHGSEQLGLLMEPISGVSSSQDGLVLRC
jgi:hypothetical protein